MRNKEERTGNLRQGILYLSMIVFTASGCGLLTREAKPPSPPEEMVYIPEGWFLMGSNEGDGRLGLTIGMDEIPQHRVYLKGFYIDRYEVTFREFRNFLKATGRKAPRILTVEEWVKIYPTPRDNHPMNGVSWYDADAYCHWGEKRLPAEEEWEKASRGVDGRQWPWGNEPNLSGSIKANTLEAGAAWTTPVGGYPEGVSPYGVYDMAGNVMEWTSSWYKPYPGSTLKRTAFGEKFKVLRGGAWENPAVPFARSAYRHAVVPKWDHPGHGFRCARD